MSKDGVDGTFRKALDINNQYNNKYNNNNEDE